MKCKLEDIALVTMGQSPKGDTYNNEGIGMPFLQGNRTFGDRYPTFDTWTTSPTKIAKAGDVIMSVRAPVGDLNITPVEMCLGRGVCSIRALNGCQDFIYYLMKYSMEQLLSKESGTVFGSVNRNDINGLEVNVPGTVEEQQKIARYLSAIDEKIETNKQINNNLFEQALTIYEEIIRNNSCKEFKLIDLLVLLKDGTHNPPKRIEKGVPLITGQTLENGFITYDKMTYIDISDYHKIHSKYQPQANDIIITKIGTVGKVAILRNCDIPIAVHCNSAILRFDNSLVSQEWAFWMMQSKEFKQEFNKRIANTVQDFVSLGRMEDIPIKLPEAPVINKYEPLLRSYIIKLSEINFENQQLQNLRDLLLPKLMSGELDVSNVDL